MGTWFPTFRKLLLWPPITTAAQRRSLLRLIAVGIEENLALSPLIAAWAADERGIQRRRLVRLTNLLDGGLPLPNAVEAVPGLLGDDDLLAIRFDAQSGTRTAAVRQSLSAPQPSPAGGVHRLRDVLIYAALLTVAFIPPLVFNHIYIVPQTLSILHDSKLQTPDVLRWSNRAAEVIVRYWFLFVIVGLALAVFLFSKRPGRSIRRALFGRWFYPLKDKRAADVLQKLAITSSAGRPMSGALSTLARYHFDPGLRQKLLFVRNELEQGADVWPSMAAVDLLSQPEERLLETADRIGNRPWVLEQLAHLKLRRTMQRLDRLAQFLLPVVVLLLGGLVLVEALALFVPLVEIVNSIL